MIAKRYEPRSVVKPLHYQRRTRLAQLMKIATMLLLLLSLTIATQAQCVVDGFDPNANGPIYTIVVQPDGKILLGGGFTMLAPNGGAAVPRYHLARLNSDGTLDTAFDCNRNCNTNGDVVSIALQADGKVLAGGWFSGARGIGGQTRNHIARLDGTTGLVDSFNPNPDSLVFSIAVQTDGKVLVGGDFTNVGGQPRNSLARLEGTTGLADSFDPNPGGEVLSLVVQADGKILVAGLFSSIGGQPRGGFARLDPTSGLADSFNPQPDGKVQSMAVQADGRVLAGGGFTNIGFARRHYLARLDGTTGLVDSFNPNVIGPPVLSIAVQADGQILAGGWFASIGGQTRNCIARLDATTGLADSFDPNPNNFVESVAVQADGRILAGGWFTSIGGQTRNHIAQLYPDCALLPNLLGNISTRLRVETGDNVLIAGFIVTGTQPKKIIVRAIGPSLSVAGALADPILELRDSSGGLIRSNDNWRSDQEAEIIATAIPPSNDLESAIVETLPANNAAYTAIVRGLNNGTGVALVEAYDLDRTVDSKLANISTRGLVQTGDNVLIAGTIVLGPASQRVLVRAIGPSLPVDGKLADPTLELRDANGALIRANDNWRSDQESEIFATGIPPSDDLESAMIETLPGNGAACTAIVRGVNDTTGIALVEVYALN